MIRTTITALLLAIAAAAFAQKPAQPSTTAPAATAVDTDSRQTRDELQSLLRRYPPQLGSVLSLDPSLLNNAQYMANYPALAAFAAQHPEVAHNPEFFLAGFGPARIDSNPVWRNVLGDIGGFAIFLVIVSVLVWAIKTLIEQRRWNRVMHVQTEVHSKLLDRFTSNEELLAYIQTPSGRRFLDSAPIPLENAPRPMSAPIGRMFWSLQAGLVAIAIGVGFDIVSMRTQGDAATLLYGIGVIGLLVGIALVVSAVIFYTLSRRFGLFEPPAVHDAN